MTDTERLLSAVQALADVPRQNETILRQMQEGRTAVHGQLAELTKGLAVHVAQCLVRHSGLDQRIAGCETSIETLFDRATESQRCARDSLAQKVAQYEAHEKEEITHSVAVITEHKTYWTRTAIAALVGLVTAALGAGGILHALIFRR